MPTFISLAISDTMFPATAVMRKRSITSEEVRVAIDNGALSALNPSHVTTIDAIYRKYGLKLPIPDRAPKILLQPGDRLIVIQAQLPRLAAGWVHSQETIENAPISFSEWEVL